MDGALIALALGFGFTPPPLPYGEFPARIDPSTQLSAAERRDWADLVNRLG